jgi:decaprenyl-phosphate phosphoribosyltransferase
VTEPVPHRSFLPALVSAVRVRQWIKNGLVVVAPAAAGTLFHHVILLHTLAAFISFSLVASCIYVLNDVRDIEDDRRHPTKRFRAIAAGHVSAGTATTVGVLLGVAGVALPLADHLAPGYFLVLGLYIAESLAYVYGMKRVAIIEMVFVASGFFLRAIAGAVASHIPVSEWFLVVISFGAIFLVVGKRSAEKRHVGHANRAVLTDYTPDFLHSSLTLAATVVVTAYCLWAFNTSATGLSATRHHVLPIQLSIVPVGVAILFIMRGAESPSGEAPEDLLLRNRTVQLLLVAWALLVATGIYA